MKDITTGGRFKTPQEVIIRIIIYLVIRIILIIGIVFGSIYFYRRSILCKCKKEKYCSKNKPSLSSDISNI